MKEVNLSLISPNEPPPTLLIQGNSLLDRSPNKFIPINLNGSDKPVTSSVTLFGQQSLLYGANRRINFGTQIPSPDLEEFTIETYCYPTDVTSNSGAGTVAGSRVIAITGDGYYSKEIYVGFSGSNFIFIYDGFDNKVDGVPPVIEINKWQHLAVCRMNHSTESTLLLFINGKLRTSKNISLNLSIDQWSKPFCIGDRPAGSGLRQYPFIGSLFNLRYTRGFCLYKENFNVPSGPFVTY